MIWSEIYPLIWLVDLLNISKEITRGKQFFGLGIFVYDVYFIISQSCPQLFFSLYLLPGFTLLINSFQYNPSKTWQIENPQFYFSDLIYDDLYFFVAEQRQQSNTNHSRRTQAFHPKRVNNPSRDPRYAIKFHILNRPIRYKKNRSGLSIFPI